MGAAVLALVRRAGVGHLHLMAPLRQRLVGFTVHLLHGSQGSAQSLSTATAQSTESGGEKDGGEIQQGREAKTVGRRRRRRDEPAEENERKRGIEQTGQGRKIAQESLLLNTVAQYCNICSFQLQQTFINSIWLLSYFTPKVSSKSIHSEGTAMVAIMSNRVSREIGQNQAQLFVLSLVVFVFLPLLQSLSAFYRQQVTSCG